MVDLAEAAPGDITLSMAHVRPIMELEGRRKHLAHDIELLAQQKVCMHA
jgi:hypothetical protein